MRTDDLAGLAAYYEGWVEKNPEDVAAMARLGELLDRQRRTAEAREWLEKAVEKAPSDARLRRALVDQLLRADEFAAAAEQFEELDRLAPGDADTLRDWGAVLLDDPARPVDERTAAAETIWRRYLDGREDDPVAVTQVADWLRQAGSEDAAKELYRKAVALAPEDPRYREYLGEYLHVLGESEEAVKVWNGLASGENKSVRTLARLSEVLGGFGYDEKAATAAGEADALDLETAGSPDPAAGELEFADRVRFAELFARAEQFKAAQTQIAKAEALAVTSEERRAALSAAVDADEAAGALADRIAELETEAEAKPTDPAVRLRLAVYRDAAGEAVTAAEAAAEAVALDPADVTALATLSELQEKAGRVGDAADTARRLADLDRPRRADHLTRVAELRLRLGERNAALRTAREVVAGSPGNPRALSFLARVAFRVGDDAAGLDALRRAARASSGDVEPLLSLSSALADRFRTDEAVALLWRAFGAAGGFDDKALVVRRLAGLATRQGRFAEFLDKLERESAPRRGGRGGSSIGGDGQDRETALLLAEAHLAADDTAAARDALEPLLARDPRDTVLLARLASLAEAAGDVDDAIGFQRRVVELSDEPAERMRLAGMLTASGDAEAAERLYLELLGGVTDPAERLSAIDRLLVAGRWRLAYRLAADGAARAPQDWELLVRLAAAAANADPGDLDAPPSGLDVDLAGVPEFVPPEADGTPEEDGGEPAGLSKQAGDRIADAALRRVWDLDLPDDAESAAVKAKRESARGRRAGAAGGGKDDAAPFVRTVSNNVWTPLMWWGKFGMDRDNLAQYRQRYGLFPTDYYGQARNAVIARLGAAPRGGKPTDDVWAFRERVYDRAGVEWKRGGGVDPGAAPTAQALWDADALLSVEGNTDGDERKPILARLNRAVSGALLDRPGAGAEEAGLFVRNLRPRARRPDEEAADPDPLSEADLARLRRAVAMQAAAPNAAGGSVGVLLAELERAGLTDEADDRAEAFVAAAESPEEVSRAAAAMAGIGRTDAVLALLDRAAELPPAERAKALPAAEALRTVVAEKTADGDLPTAFAVLDAHAEATAEAAAGGSAGGSAGSATGPRSVRVRTQQGNRTFIRMEQVFPPPAAPVDDGQVTLLYEQFKLLRDPAAEGGVADAAEPPDPGALLAHLEARAADESAPHRWHDLLRLACVRAWGGDAAGAVEALKNAQAADPDNAALRRVTAAALIERGDPGGGLDVLDAAEPRSPDDLRDRELLALRTAAAAGRLDRAREAAERLFGLRLNETERLELARAMQRLGMGEQAASVLNRLRRGNSGDAATLSGVLDLYRRRGEDGTAAEVARSILSRVRPAAPRPGYGTSSADRAAQQARERAVRALRDLDQLDPVVEDLKAKLARNPNAADVRTDLLALLVAAGRRAEAEALIKEDRPAAADPAALMAAATRLRASGDNEAAAELYEQVIAKDPSQVANEYWEISQTADQAGRYRELMEAVGKTDPADWGQRSYALTNLLTNNLYDDEKRDASVAAFKSIWDRHPEARDELFGSVSDARLIGADGVYEYARDKLLGKDGSRPGWDAIFPVKSWINGEPDSLASVVLRAAAERGDLDEFTAALTAQTGAAPDWHAGRGLLAAAKAAGGDPDAARGIVEALLALPEADRPGGSPAWLLSVDLGPLDLRRLGPSPPVTSSYEPSGHPLRDLQLALMERAVATGATSPFSGNGFEYHPEARLAELLAANGRKPEARRLLLDAAFDPPADPNRAQFRSMNPQYAVQQDVRSWTAIGKQLSEMGLPMDALRVLNHAAVEGVAKAGPSRGSYYIRQLEEATGEVREQLTPAAVAADLAARAEAERTGAEDPGVEGQTDGPALDLFVTATDGGEELAKAEIRSGLLAALLGEGDDEDGRDEVIGDDFSTGSVQIGPAAPAPTFGGILAAAVANLLGVGVTPAVAPAMEAPPADPEAEAAEAAKVAARMAADLDPLRAAVADFAAVRPADGSLRATAALLAFAADDPAGAADPVAALARLAEAAPVPSAEDDDAGPAPGTVGSWWLVGEEASKHPETAADGRVLTDAALAAAEALPDPAWRTAMRVEAGRAALDRGDRAAAEAAWTDLLGDVLGRDLSGEEGDADPPGDAGAFLAPKVWPIPDVRAAVIVAAVGADPDAAPKIPVTTGPRARRALQLAQLAADAGLTDLSLRAVRETLAGGAPLGGAVTPDFALPVLPANRGGGGMFGTPGVGPGAGEPFPDDDLANALLALSKSWDAAGADPAAVAGTLLEVVLPTARPGEAFVYPGFTNVTNDAAPPGDALAPLLGWAARADLLGEVEVRAADRAAAGAAGELIAVRLALARGETGGVAEDLTALADRARQTGAEYDGKLAMHAALPALDAGVAPAEAFAAFEAGARAAGGDGGISSRFLPRLAREAFARGEAERGTRFLDALAADASTRSGRSNADYAAFQRRNALATVVTEAARGGAVAFALDRLRELEGVELGRRYGGGRELDRPRLAADLARGAAALPADEAFEALLAWTVPRTDGKPAGTVRGLAAPLPADLPPAEFGTPADPARTRAAAAGRPPAPLTGTAVALAAAAVKSGRTDELAAALDAAAAAPGDEPAAGEKPPAGDENLDERAELAAVMRATIEDRPVEEPSAASAVTAAAVRLLAGLPVDVPTAFDAAESSRGWAAKISGAGRNDDVRTAAATQAVGANALLVWAAIGVPEHRDAASAELAKLEDWANAHDAVAGPFRPALRAMRAEADALAAAPGLPIESQVAAADRGAWRSAALGSYAVGPPDRPAWVLLHGSAYATGSAGANVLMFRLPLTGEFAVEVVAADGENAEPAPVYGGLIHEAHGWNRSYRARDFSGARFAETDADWLTQGRDRRLRLGVAPDAVTLHADGRRVFRDDAPAAGSPFLGLAATDGRRPTFRTVRLVGEPTVPDSVDLLAGGRADGWFAPTGNGVPPRPGFDREEGERRAERWAVGDGGLVGEANAGRLTHHRPLWDGDELRFRFRTAGTTATVVPSLDRLGFVLDPAGVRLRWLPVAAPGGRWAEDGGLPAANAVAAPGALGPVPLVADDWNEATFAVAGGRLTLSVNGTPVLERDLSEGAGTAHGAATPDRLFGLAPAAGRRAEVRDVILTGDWPTSVPEAWKGNLLLAGELSGDAADPLGPVELNDETVARGRRDVKLISHGAVTHGTWDLLVAADRLPAADRLKLLAGVVLPTPADPFWRCDLAFSPTNPPPGTDLPGVETPADGRRVPTGGNLLSPVTALVDAAAELGRLDDLRAAAEARPAWGVEAADIKAGLLAAVAAKSGNDPGPHVAALLDSLRGFDKDGETFRPRPHLVAARALADAALPDLERGAARDGAEALAAAFMEKYRENGGVWRVRKRQARRALIDLAPAGPADLALAAHGWAAAPEVSLSARAEGFPPAAWLAAGPGVVAHLGGGVRDRLFAVRPAAPADGGELTVSAEPSFDWGEQVRVLVGGLGAALVPGEDRVDVRSLARRRGEAALKAEPGADGGRYALTQTLAAGRFAAAVGGASVWEAALGTRQYDPPLPFLALEAGGEGGGSVRNLRTSGAVETPDAFDLLPVDADVPDWWLDAHGPADRRTTAGWTRDGDLLALTGPSKSGLDPGRERLLVFPRPLAAATETVRYEFFHPAESSATGSSSVGDAAARAGVHPALGGLAFVLTDAGVRLHRVTAGPEDRTGLTADNLTVPGEAGEPGTLGADALDLAPDRWHGVELTVDGDALTLSLDGAVILERPVAPANDRTFGLFRWAGGREVRVRNATLTGAWAAAPAAAPAD